MNPKAIGRTELAQRYNPQLSPGRAWEKLKEWIAINGPLTRRLEELHYDPKKRSFTPLQVAAIFEALGEPD